MLWYETYQLVKRNYFCEDLRFIPLQNLTVNLTKLKNKLFPMNTIEFYIQLLDKKTD